MKKLLLLSSLLSVVSLSYAMDNERAKKIAQQDEEMDRMLIEAQAMNARMKDVSRKLGVPVDQERPVNNNEVSVKKTLGKLDRLNAGAQNFADRARALRTPKSTAQKKEEEKEESKKPVEVKTRKDYSSFLTSLEEIRQARKSKKVSSEEFVTLKTQLESNGVYEFFRDMKIIEMIFGVRSEKREAQERLYDVYSSRLGNNLSHHLHELQVSLKVVETGLKKNPNDKALIAQKQLVGSEIQSFSNVKNHNSFYRSSMQRSKFDLFKQCRAATERE